MVDREEQHAQDVAEGNGAFSVDAMTRLAEESPIQDYLESVEEEIEADLQDRTPKGRKSKAARTAEEIRQFQQVVHTAASGLNALLAAKVPELEYTEDELNVVGKLGGKILAKHVDSAMTEYGDEITLAGCPRTRGDRPPAPGGDGATGEVPPHTRG